ncbi:zinc-dependent alcohol dehydrogenase [Microbacterium hatanonis]|uniref:Zinc-binding dehydrogenase n=1 Tax=Microbacterium hatanonis TaxID=404366 RepID=A0A5C8HV98_9MICO|nr:zinc-binding dehydrogenase [Microbacterium hatanonis]TXK09989.1 zinc-binding dehydrogenase [Microbacterium hatanonis]
MTTARAAFLSGPSRFEIEEVTLPEISADDALLRVEVNGLCGSDIEQVTTGGRFGRLVPGHEPVGVIDRIGADAARRWGVAEGDRVAVEVVVPCHRCRQCVAGVFSSCEDSVGAYGYRPVPGSALTGGFGEYMYLHPNSVMHRISNDVPFVEAAMYNPLAAGFRWANHLGGVKEGDTVVVFGAGQRGIAAAIAALSVGAAHVIATGLTRDAHKLELARRFGVETTIDVEREDAVERIAEVTGGRGADVVLDLTPNAAQPVRDSLDVARMGGTVVLAGLKHGASIEIVTDRIVQKGLRVIGARGVEGRAIGEAIALIESGAYPLGSLSTHTFGLDDAARAIEVLAGRVDDEPSVHVSMIP